MTLLLIVRPLRRAGLLRRLTGSVLALLLLAGLLLAGSSALLLAGLLRVVLILLGIIH
jgi:hypothetical protein